MKVALCLSGHLRSFETTHLSIKSFLIDKLNADVFIHTWSYVGLSPNIDKSTVGLSTDKTKFKEYFNPIKSIIEPIIYNKGEKYRKYLVDSRCPNGIANMYYKIHMADKLREDHETANNFKYDIVIRSRPDLMFDGFLDQSCLDNAIEKNYLYLPDCGHFDGLNDQFAFGNSEVMKTYSDCYNQLDKLCLKVPFKPEPILKRHIIDSKLDLRFSTVNYLLCRVNGQIFDSRIIAPGSPDLSTFY